MVGEMYLQKERVRYRPYESCRTCTLGYQENEYEEQRAVPEMIFFDASSRALHSTANPGKIKTTPAVDMAE